jgi:hypothetical protein
MAVIINLREVSALDSQSDLSSKLNFNFNQLIALGIGQTGPTGPAGLTGAAGPIGPIGLTGPQGSVTYGLSAAIAPVTAPTGGSYPSAMVLGDILITADTILKKVSGGNGWLELANFNTLVQTALSSNISPFVRLTPTSRILKARVSSGSDLTNSATSTDPSYATPGAGVNYQTVLYNFNELNSKSVIFDGSNIVISANSSTAKTFAPATAVNTSTEEITFTSNHGLVDGQFVTYSAEGGTAIGGLSNFNGYFVLKISDTVIQLCETAADVTNTNPINLTSTGSGTSPHKLITYPSSTEKMFPATSNLSLYSYFNGTATEAKEFATTSKGYRHQLELGSIDALSTSYTSGSAGESYVISPSFENLRMRKYRLSYGTSFGNEANPGTYFLRAEYDLSSSGITASPESFAPRRSSEQIWKINRAEALQADGRSIEMKFTNYRILTDTESASTISIDGLFFKRNASFGGGSAAAYWGAGFNSANNNITFKIGSTSSVFEFRNPIQVISSTGAVTTYGGTGITGVPTSGNSFTIAAPVTDLAILTVDATKELRLNNAIKIKGDRLNQGIPFPATQIPSADANTLDDYEEGTVTNALFLGRYETLSGGKLILPTNYHSYATANSFSGFQLSQSFTYTKIGRRVHFNSIYTLDLNSWPADDMTSGSGYYTYTGLGLSLPFSASAHGHLNAQVTVTDITTLPDPQPDYTGISYIQTYSNYLGSLISNGDAARGWIYLQSQHAFPANEGSTVTNRLSQFSLFNRAARAPLNTSNGEYGGNVTIRISGSYDATA